MRSDLFSAENLEKESNQPGLRLQNSKLLKAELNGEFMARTGSMVAYQGQVQFQALGFSFAGTAILTFSYGFLEGLGYPRLSMFSVWPILAVLWIVGLLLARRRYQ